MEAILLREMSEEAFEPYFQNKLERYTEVLSQNIHEEGDHPSTKARNQLTNLLPMGMRTPNHHFFTIDKGENSIGFVWLKVEEEKKSAFLYEIYIFEEFRGKGFGTAAMKCVEDFLQQKEIYYFKLHVFGNNTGARKLYEELGFEVAGVNMLKSFTKR